MQHTEKKVIYTVKQIFYKSHIGESNKITTMWNVLSHVWNKKQKHSDNNLLIEINGIETTDSSQIANSFKNRYYFIFYSTNFLYLFG